MALQAHCGTTISFSFSKSGVKYAGKENVNLGIAKVENKRIEFTSSNKRISRSNGTIRAQAVAAPTEVKESPSSKKTDRKKSVVITGASSGLGLAAAKALGESGEWHVTMACRDFLKAERVAKNVGIPRENYSVIHCDLASLESVKQFVENFRRTGRPLDALVCNAAVYLPTAKEPTFTADGYELSVGTNHLGHFLLSRLMLEDLKQSDAQSKRLIIVGSITGNTNTLAGNVPPKANLGDMRGLAGGLNGVNTSPMIDGGKFDGAKAYKDSKVCNMLTMQEFHRRYHEETGITFSSLYPGCIATTGLFREHIPLFRLLFPPFQKYITKGYVSEEEAGKRLAQVVSNPSLSKSGVYWSWNNDSASFENQLSEEASDSEKARKEIVRYEVIDRMTQFYHVNGQILASPHNRLKAATLIHSSFHANIPTDDQQRQLAYSKQSALDTAASPFPGPEVLVHPKVYFEDEQGLVKGRAIDNITKHHMFFNHVYLSSLLFIFLIMILQKRRMQNNVKTMFIYDN